MAGVLAFLMILILVVVAIFVFILYLMWDAPRIRQNKIYCPRRFKLLIKDEAEPYGYAKPKVITSESGDYKNYYQTYNLQGEALNGALTSHIYPRGQWVVKDEISAFATGVIVLERLENQSKIMELKVENNRLKGEIASLKTDIKREQAEQATSIMRFTEAYGKKAASEEKKA